MRGGRRSGIVMMALVLGMTASGCGFTIPSDPEGGLDRVMSGTLRVGYAPEPGLIAEGTPDPVGPLVAVVVGYATSIDADVEWTLGSEETLANDIDRGDLDLAVGGFTESTPWTDFAALTRGFVPPGQPVETRRSVALLPLGENALLSSFETYVDEEGLT